MTHRVYTMTEEAMAAGLDWDEAISSGKIETVEEFDSYEEAVAAYDDRYFDSDVYGVE